MTKSGAWRVRKASATWRGGRAMRGGDLGEDASAGRARAGEAALAEGAVADHGDAVPLAPGDHRVLDGALPQMVEHLVAGDAAAGDALRFLEVGDVEIADAPRQDLAGALQLVEGGDGVGEGMGAAPMQQVAVEPVGLETGERALAGGPHAGTAGVLRQHLGDEEDLVSPPGDRLGDDLFRRAGAVHLGRVDMRHAAIEACAEGGDGGGALGALDHPGTLSDQRHGAVGRAEGACLHAMLLIRRQRRSRLAATKPVAAMPTALIKKLGPTAKRARRSPNRSGPAACPMK